MAPRPATFSFRPREIECAGVVRTGKEPDELLVGSPPDPIEDAAIFCAEVGRAFEHHYLADQAAFHLDRVFVGASAVTFKDGFQYAILLFDLGVEFFADVFGWGCPLRRVVSFPCACPRASDVWRWVYDWAGAREISTRAFSTRQRI